jgi:hypothetical protein
VRFVIEAMPPPEPIGAYVALTPTDFAQTASHAVTSGDTKVLPAPVSESS